MKFIAILAAIASVNAAETTTPQSGPRCDFDLTKAFGHPCWGTKRIVEGSQYTTNTKKDGIRLIKNHAQSAPMTWFSGYYRLKPGVDPNNVRCDFKVISISKEGSIKIGNTKAQPEPMHIGDKKWGNAVDFWTSRYFSPKPHMKSWVVEQTDEGHDTKYSQISHTPVLGVGNTFTNVSVYNKGYGDYFFSQETEEGEQMLSPKMSEAFTDLQTKKEAWPQITLQLSLNLDEYVEVIEEVGDGMIADLEAKAERLKKSQTAQSQGDAVCEADFSEYKQKVQNALEKVRAEAKKTFMQ